MDKYLQKRIDQKLAKLNKLRPLPSSAVAKLREQFAIEMTYNSNAIEGNTLTQKETFLVIREGLTIKGKSLKDHLEAKDHYEALEFLYDLVDKDKQHTFSETLIRQLQSLVVKETDPQIAGQYRKINVVITGSAYHPPQAHEVPIQMKKLIEWVRKNQRKLHSVELAALLHHKLVYIHPFEDGNGRSARLVMNIKLMQAGFPLVIILKNDRKKYYDSLAKADKGNSLPFVRFIAQAVERSLNIYLKILIPTKVDSKKFMPLSIIAKQTPYSQKYLNLLANQGRIEAHKEGRNWVTTLEAIEDYQKGRERKRQRS